MYAGGASGCSGTGFMMSVPIPIGPILIGISTDCLHERRLDMSAPHFAELVVASNYSFLRGASHPADLLERAAALGMTAIGIADRNSVAGVVRAHSAWRALGGAASGFRLVVGARLVFSDGTPDIVAYPATRAGWGRLTRLLTLGNRRAEKGDCLLRLEDLLEHVQDLLLIMMPSGDASDAAVLETLSQACPGSIWLAATMPRGAKAGSRRKVA